MPATIWLAPLRSPEGGLKKSEQSRFAGREFGADLPTADRRPADYRARSASLLRTPWNAGVWRNGASSGSTGIVQPENDSSALSSKRWSAAMASSCRPRTAC